jgi:hypothetical protein
MNERVSARLKWFILPVILLLLAGCAGNSSGSQNQNSSCKDDLTFLRDITIPDGSTAVTGAAINKRWQVQNSGTCDWGKGYSLHLVTGELMGTSDNQTLYPAEAGGQAVIEMDFTAPSAPGIYRSVWQAYNPDNVAFGDRFFLEITVTSPTVSP